MEIQLRPWSLDDIPALAQMANNSRIAVNMTDAFPHPYRPEDAAMFVSFATSHEPLRLFAVMFEGSLAGGIGLHPQQDISRKNAELGYWIAEPFWGRGIATAAVKKIVPMGFSMFDINRIFARPFGYNKASQRVLEKNGFILEATIRDGFFKDGKYCDELIYARRRESLNL